MQSWGLWALPLLLSQYFFFTEPAAPNLFGTREQFQGRQFFHGLGVRKMALGCFKCITFIVCFISNLMASLI